MTSASHTYRRDIDGLRAVAVAAVVLFHAGVEGFGGGFTGVDVFFMISGFLITSIITAEIRAGTFSIAAFYERRIRRIFPALFAVLFVSSVLAALLFLPDDFDEFGKSLVSATLFSSNMFFWQASDYFAGPAHLKPLLHTWSLAVEEQFYIVYPVALAAIWRWGRAQWLMWLGPAMVVSFAISVWGAEHKPIAAFYLAPTRVFELLIGALLVLGNLPRPDGRVAREVLASGGVFLMAAAVVLFSKETVFPGSNALIPCLGAALILYTGGLGETWVSRVLSLRPVVGLGLISYSLYLWHWPLLAFARYWNAEALSPAVTWSIVLASVALAVLSWRFVEQPFRTRRVVMARRPLFDLAGGAMLGAVAFGVFAWSSQGWPQRFDGFNPPEIAGRAALKEGTCFLRPEQAPRSYAGQAACSTGAGGMTVVVWGDSFAAHLVPGLADVGADHLRIVQVTAGGCPPILGRDTPRRPHCRAFNDAALQIITDVKPDVVVLSARWEAYMPRFVRISDVAATADQLNRLGVGVVLSGQSPSFDFAHPYEVVYRKGRDVARVNFDSDINQRLARLENVTFFDPQAALCRGAICPVRDETGYLYFDGGHFSTIGSAKLARQLMPSIQKSLVAGKVRHAREAARTNAAAELAAAR